MSLEENKKLILDHYDAFYRGDTEAMRKQLSADFVDHEMPPGTAQGPEPALRGREMLLQAFPDLSVKIEDIVAEGDRVAVRATWQGTHTGLFLPLSLPPTNRKVAITGMVFWRIRDGRIVERWANVDRALMKQQLIGAS